MDSMDPIHRLLSPPGDDISALPCLEMEIMHLDSKAPTTVLLKTLWFYIKKMLGMQGFLTHTPLWHNLSYKEMLKLKGFREWEEAGLRYISQLYSGSTLNSFMDIQAEFALPRCQFFRYLQLRHALQVKS